ncbi:hypothetical protein [Micromonospora sp. NBRC 101691]|uniref:hypothetical protein n=1 Tax=Micromonospora sp. NBRC 101691 TaxID=3032198 RepID=UPI0024A5BF7A|nr:hypothetical protein [Micromonospora sp. NBRC 101691]GLY21804.1 hypothetical protein Misp04_15360 [Micromonospora sp. NBRC 101691]
MSDGTRFRRFGARGLVIVLAGALVGVVAPASPASAAVPGLMRISATSSFTSNNFQSVTAVCPVGKVLLGAGYEIIGAAGEVTVDDFRPSGSATTAPTSVYVGAYEIDELADPWMVKAYAVCADPVAGLVRIAVTNAYDSADVHSVVASCPTGKVLTGTGFEMQEVVGKGIVDDLRPNGTSATAPTSVDVRAYEADPFFGPWTLTAYAICANPLPGLVQVSATSGTSSDDYRSSTAVCPSGKVLTGGGFEARDAFGQVVVDDFSPNGGPATGPTSVITGAYEEDPYSSDWSVRTFALCASM